MPYLQYAFCPHDGSRLEPQADASGERRPACGRCGFIDYGNPKPCVAALVVSEGRLLLARRAVEPAKGMWDLVGGFIDAGESAEDAVRREVLEETGLQVKVGRLLGSFPDIYGPRAEPTLNLCFVAEPTGGTLAPQSDVAELQWFGPAELPENMAFAHQRQALDCWRTVLSRSC